MAVPGKSAAAASKSEIIWSKVSCKVFLGIISSSVDESTDLGVSSRGSPPNLFAISKYIKALKNFASPICVFTMAGSKVALFKISITSLQDLMFGYCHLTNLE